MVSKLDIPVIKGIVVPLSVLLPRVVPNMVGADKLGVCLNVPHWCWSGLAQLTDFLGEEGMFDGDRDGHVVETNGLVPVVPKVHNTPGAARISQDGINAGRACSVHSFKNSSAAEGRCRSGAVLGPIGAKIKEELRVDDIVEHGGGGWVDVEISAQIVRRCRTL